ncbi:hypothetical protein QYE76_024033 [Lolium multiflorum]|uniref:B box-type domain-containing protein n=1 Tax=Lolium multiflorum TaxID=4521 RepID=A0AAD8VUP8_LOLMU|nr:hypothetical protein QYE76_024033 [Lolium multiflorum]
MKVQCDVCAAEAASVFCCADEAALCDACDRRVHRANKLAGKHRRFSLLHPSSSSSAAQMPPPLCDICQEKRGFLFCKEDRAILCRECDAAVHTASELATRHARYLLTGVRISSEPAASPAPPSQEQENTSSLCCSGDDDAAWPAPSHGASSGGSSISEYLTKTLPGWHVEDFLVDDATAAAAASAAGSSYQGVAENLGLHEGGYPAAWTAQEHWVPRVYAAELGGSKRSRTTSGNPYW